MKITKLVFLWCLFTAEISVSRAESCSFQVDSNSVVPSEFYEGSLNISESHCMLAGSPANFSAINCLGFCNDDSSCISAGAPASSTGFVGYCNTTTHSCVFDFSIEIENPEANPSLCDNCGGGLCSQSFEECAKKQCSFHFLEENPVFSGCATISAQNTPPLCDFPQAGSGSGPFSYSPPQFPNNPCGQFVPNTPPPPTGTPVFRSVIIQKAGVHFIGTPLMPASGFTWNDVNPSPNYPLGPIIHRMKCDGSLETVGPGDTPIPGVLYKVTVSSAPQTFVFEGHLIDDGYISDPNGCGNTLPTPGFTYYMSNPFSHPLDVLANPMISMGTPSVSTNCSNSGSPSSPLVEGFLLSDLVLGNTRPLQLGEKLPPGSGGFLVFKSSVFNSGTSSPCESYAGVNLCAPLLPERTAVRYGCRVDFECPSGTSNVGTPLSENNTELFSVCTKEEVGGNCSCAFTVNNKLSEVLHIYPNPLNNWFHPINDLSLLDPTFVHPTFFTPGLSVWHFSLPNCSAHILWHLNGDTVGCTGPTFNITEYQETLVSTDSCEMDDPPFNSDNLTHFSSAAETTSDYLLDFTVPFTEIALNQDVILNYERSTDSICVGIGYVAFTPSSLPGDIFFTVVLNFENSSVVANPFGAPGDSSKALAFGYAKDNTNGSLSCWAPIFPFDPYTFTTQLVGCQVEDSVAQSSSGFGVSATVCIRNVAQWSGYNPIVEEDLVYNISYAAYIGKTTSSAYDIVAPLNNGYISETIPLDECYFTPPSAFERFLNISEPLTEICDPEATFNFEEVCEGLQTIQVPQVTQCNLQASGVDSFVLSAGALLVEPDVTALRIRFDNLPPVNARNSGTCDSHEEDLSTPYPLIFDSINYPYSGNWSRAVGSLQIPGSLTNETAPFLTYSKSFSIQELDSGCIASDGITSTILRDNTTDPSNILYEGSMYVIGYRPFSILEESVGQYQLFNVECPFLISLSTDGTTSVHYTSQVVPFSAVWQQNECTGPENEFFQVSFITCVENSNNLTTPSITTISSSSSQTFLMSTDYPEWPNPPACMPGVLGTPSVPACCQRWTAVHPGTEVLNGTALEANVEIDFQLFFNGVLQNAATTLRVQIGMQADPPCEEQLIVREIGPEVEVVITYEDGSAVGEGDIILDCSVICANISMLLPEQEYCDYYSLQIDTLTLCSSSAENSSQLYNPVSYDENNPNSTGCNSPGTDSEIEIFDLLTNFNGGPSFETVLYPTQLPDCLIKRRMCWTTHPVGATNTTILTQIGWFYELAPGVMVKRSVTQENTNFRSFEKRDSTKTPSLENPTVMSENGGNDMKRSPFVNYKVRCAEGQSYHKGLMKCVP